MGHRTAFRARFFVRCFLKISRTPCLQLPLAGLFSVADMMRQQSTFTHNSSHMKPFTKPIIKYIKVLTSSNKVNLMINIANIWPSLCLIGCVRFA